MPAYISCHGTSKPEADHTQIFGHGWDAARAPWKTCKSCVANTGLERWWIAKSIGNNGDIELRKSKHAMSEIQLLIKQREKAGCGDAALRGGAGIRNKISAATTSFWKLTAGLTSLLKNMGFRAFRRQSSWTQLFCRFRSKITWWH